MINKDKINKVMIYDRNGKLLLTTKSVYFPKDFFGIRGKDLVMLKGADFPLITKDEYIDVIFEYLNGARMKYSTSVDLCTEYQINFHVGDGIALQERRRYFKINVQFVGTSPFYIRDGEMCTFDSPICVDFVNLNIGGAYLRSEFEFRPEDQVMLNFLDGEMELLAEVLRVQKIQDTDEVDGYGCRFLNVTSQQEERLARFILECQLIERERMRNEKSKRAY
ncbi:MAG: PilZ domain-containing protein [Oscillospiraceae bacterium]